jgi:hypothetical protein
MQLTVKNLLKMLSSSSDLLDMLFIKRDGIVSFLQTKAYVKEEQIENLVEHGLLINDDSGVELDENLLIFLESTLGSNDEIEIGNLGELLSEISNKIELYNASTSFEQRQKYIKRIDRILKKIPLMISRSLIKLHQHIHLTYKSANNYELKLVELKFYQEKLELLKEIDIRIEITLKLESDFFKNQVPPLTSSLYFGLKSYLTQMRISLVDLQRQVVDYINRVSPDVGFFKHMTRLKELKNSYEIREHTNIQELTKNSNTPFALLPRLMFSTQLEKEYAYSVDFSDYVERWYQKNKLTTPSRSKAKGIDESYFEESAHEEYFINTEDLHLEFKETSSDLFSYVMNKEFGFEQDFDDRLSIYCDIAGIYAKEYYLTADIRTYKNYEYLLIYSKENR